jgi:hypothetical protein
MWINIDPASAGHSRILIEGDVSNGIQFRLGPSNTTNINGLSVSRVFNADNEYCSYTFEFNTWYHVAVVRASAVYYFFVNGVQQTTQGSGTSTYSFATAALVSIGDNNSYPNDEIYKGYISNIRVSSVGRYTSNFTPSTTPLTALSNTQFLSLQNNRWIDNSTNASAISVVGSSGTPSIQAFSPFLPTAAYDAAVVGGSGYFDGTGDYLNSTITAVSDFTVECWAYFTTAASKTILTIGDGSATSGFELYTNSASYIVMGNATGSVSTNPTTLKANQWYHFAATRSGSTITAYVNGVSIGTANMGSTTLATTIRVGVEFYSSTLAQYFTGYIGSLRVSNTVRTGLTTLPTAPYTSDANTVYLLNYTNAGIFDSTAKNVLETVGNAQVSTTQAKWGTTSMYFDGTGDYLNAGKNEMFSIGSAEDFTFEAWIYAASVSDVSVFGIGSSTTFAYRILSGSPYIYVQTTGGLLNSGTITANTWTHIAISRSGGTMRSFLNGVQAASVANTGSFSASAGTGAGVYAGAANLAGASTPGYVFNGYIDDLRFTKGYARYTANFTAPTAAFPLQ